MEIISEPEWEILFKSLAKCKGISVIIGKTDSGKSTLVHYLIDRFILGNMKVCLVDSDVGQSSLGLPGTISMKLFIPENGLEDFAFEKMSFIGTLNPARDVASIIKQTKRMSNLCTAKSDSVLVDTSGLISGEAGRTLKTAKIRALKPEHVIAIQRREELEAILELLEGPGIHKIRASAAARTIPVRAASGSFVLPIGGAERAERRFQWVKSSRPRCPCRWTVTGSCAGSARPASVN